MIGNALLVCASFCCPFLGSVFILYSLRGTETLTDFEAVGCFLVAFPFAALTVIGLVLLDAFRAANSQRSPESGE